MKSLPVLTILVAIALAGATASADTPAKAPAPAERKAPAAPAPAPTPPADKKAPPAKKEIISEAEAAKFVAFFDKLVSIVVANKDDCVKMAAGLNAHIDANTALLKEASDPKNKDKDLPQAAKDRIEKKSKEELDPALKKKCVTDKAVGTAFGRLGG